VSADLLNSLATKIEPDHRVLQEPSADHHVLYHERGFTEQILWSVNFRDVVVITMFKYLNRSASGSHLLTRSPRGIKIWTKVSYISNFRFRSQVLSQDGVCLKTIRRPHIVKFLQWVPLADSKLQQILYVTSET
jgi:hypothetical protein